MFGSDKDYNIDNIDLDSDNPYISGYAVLNEFMAEYVALYMNDNDGFGAVYNPNMYLQMAFQTPRTVNTYWLSSCCAIMVGDYTVPEKR